ncbi:Histone-lysine N-methyltransferase ASH1L [Anabarilius grahami]|uniref:Histone-lysine N-methyltransferase ASH1L n=1 Tax=Anabarilius grahami TaxID=495550 RepID=A0A3N0XIH8_ANAGA|nr:Histone-lysine N-methyltransferase ASH1L [Anabarilius grahami]
MDKKRQKATPAPRLEKEERTEDRKRMRKTKGAEPEASSKNTNIELKPQQQTRPGELTDTKSDQSDGNVRMKIGVGAKRTKKPPKSLENFICRPTIRISQRLAHGDGHSSSGGEVSSSEIRVGKQSNREIQKKDSSNSISAKGSTRMNLPLPTSSKKGDSTPVITGSKKTPSKNMRKTDSKSLFPSDGPSYAVQPQTDSKVPLSDRITSSTLLKQTNSPPAAPSPPSSLQQNSSPQDSTQVLNVQKEKGKDLPTGEAMTSSLSSECSEVMTLNAQASQQSSSSLENDSTSFPISCSENSLKQTPCPSKKTSRVRESHADKVSNANEKEDGDSACSKNMCNTITNKMENGLLHQASPSIKIPLLLSASDKSAESPTPENSTCTKELPESRERNKKYNESEVIDDTRKMTMEPAQTVAVQPNDGCRMGHIIDKNKKKDRHSSNQEEDAQCSSQTSSCADSQFNSSVLSDESPLHPKQNTISQNNQNTVEMTKMANKGEKMDLVKTANVSSTASKRIPQKTKPIKVPYMKSSKALSSQQGKTRPVGRPPKSKQLQHPSPRSETSSLEPPPKKRGRPKIIRLDESPQGSQSQKSFTKLPILEHSNVPDPEDGLKLPKPTPKTQVHPKCSSSVKTKKSKSQDSSSGKKGAEGKLKPSLSKARDAQIRRKRNRLIMKTIIKNINKMRVKKKDKVLTQFLSGQSQSYTSDFAQKNNEGDADCSVSDGTHSLSSLLTSFGAKLGPQINVSKRGTIYIGKRRGRKPKTQRETSGQDSGQVLSQKSQQVLTESSNQLNSLSTSGEHSHSFNGQSALCSFPYSFKHLESPSPTISSFQRKLHPGNHEYDQHSASKVTSSQKVKAVPEEKSKPPSSSQSAPHPSATSQLGSVRIQDHRTTHLARSALMEQERLKYKCHRKGHNCFSHDKTRRHKHKCKKKFLQLRAKRQDPAFLAEVEKLVVRLSEIHIVHHISSRGCGDEAKSGRKSGKGKAHVLQCLPQNLHHPTMFQINFSGYYSPQSEFSRDSLHYVGMADFKRNNGCPSQPGEHIVTHCPVVHKLGFPLSGGGCYHSPYKMPLSSTSFGFGLYSGYPPSATIYPSSPFLPSYVHPYSKNSILSPSKFHKRKHKFLKRDSVLCSGKPQATYANVTSHSSSDWFSRNSWQRKDNREQGRDKRFVDDRLREREGTEGLQGQSKLRKDHFRRGLSSNSPCSSSTPLKQTDQQKTSPLSYIGPAHLRPISKVRWAEHQQPWRWRESFHVEPRNRGLNQEAGSGYQEDDDEGDEDLPSPPLVDRTIHHHAFLRNPNLASSGYSRMTGQRSTDGVQCASRNLMRPGSSMMKESCSAGGKRTSVFPPSPRIPCTCCSSSALPLSWTLSLHSLYVLLFVYAVMLFSVPWIVNKPCYNCGSPCSPHLSAYTAERRKKRDEARSNEGQVDEGKDVTLSQEPSQSHADTSSPSQDPSVSVNSQSEKRSAVPHEKKYEWAGLYSNVYKSENPMSLSSPVHKDCLEYDPEEHEHGLLPAPIHVEMSAVDQLQRRLKKKSVKQTLIISFPINLTLSNSRSFVLEHGIFLVRNYEKMRDRQALLLREEVTEREKENKEDGGSSQSQKGDLEDTSTKSDRRLTHSSPQSENRLSGEGDEEGRSVQSRNLTQTLQGIYDVIVSHKGTTVDFINRDVSQNAEREARSGSAPVDLSMLQRQLLSGHYESLDTFHSDMLKVFHCAEVKTALLEMPFVSMDMADA